MPDNKVEACQHYNVIIIGGGQAGLSVSWHLKQQGIEHVIFEKHSLAHTWRNERWDTFCLVTPNWQCRLPGYEYRGSDPYGFMLRDEIVEYIEGFAASFDPPLRCGVHVEFVRQEKNGVFHLHTSVGSFTAGQVVIAAGGYQIPIIPRSAERLPKDIVQVHSSNYRNPESLPEGSTLVVGSGQSGAQIAEDLHIAGRKTYLCVGEAPRVARVYRGKDVVEWLDLMGYYDLAVDQHPLREGVRDKTNHYVTGRDGGREIDLRLRALQGMELYGIMSDVRGDEIIMQPNLTKNLDDADAVNESIKASIDKFISANDFDARPEPSYEPIWVPPFERTSLNLREANITSIVWCIGFHTDYRWIDLPVFNGRGAPVHHRGVAPIAGFYFVGLPWQYTWGSGRFSGVARDAAYIAEQIHSWSLEIHDASLSKRA
jgi:putative flavoprotein involved in K+ transport